MCVLALDLHVAELFPALLSLLAILNLGIGNRLPLHIDAMIGATSA